MTLEQAKATLYDKVNWFKDAVYVPLCVKKDPSLQAAGDALQAAALGVHEAKTLEEVESLSAALDKFTV